MTLANYLRAALVGASLAAIPLISSAQSDRGNDLLQRLDAFAAQKGGFSGGAGAGYVVGVADTLTAIGTVCLPGGVSNGQVTAVVHKYLRDNPAVLHQNAVVLVARALMDSFPCKDKP